MKDDDGHHKGGGRDETGTGSESRNTRALSRFEMHKYIGGGSFGQIFSAVDRKNNKVVAIKAESNKVKSPKLLLEYTVYDKYLRGCVGFPEVSHFSRSRNHQFFVMTLLGKNIEELFKKCDSVFTMKTVLMLTDQIIQRLQTMHDQSGYLHRDIKPENMMMGRNKDDKTTLYMVDLGLAKPFVDLETGNHIPMTTRRGGLTGSARYCSINAHHGGDQGRRDDMESAGYVIIYLAKGRLPWQGIKASNKMQRYEMICEIKMRTKTKELCQGLPKEFGQYMDYVKVLEFDERPDYELLRQLFLEIMDENGWLNDLEFDWFKHRRDY